MNEHPPRHLPWWLLPGLTACAPALALSGEIAAAHALLHPACVAFFASATLANCSWFGPVVTAFATTRPEVWLTIDDGPDPEDTPRLLDLLEASGARATFFVIGEKASRHPELVDEILRRGHALGNHTQTHPVGTFWGARPSTARREFALARDAIRHPTTLVRAPVGMANAFVHREVQRLGLLLVGWSVRTYDTRPGDPAAIAERAQGKLRPGSIVLLHEGHRFARGASHHPAVLAALLTRMEGLGLRGVIPPGASLLSRGRLIHRREEPVIRAVETRNDSC